ncbi:uncharacterized protein CANTADRAFT_50740 [Suhomyces tanzawaensis NRRL Y-17324]|uniref:Rad21/Rec8-like protein N-terminal domain-containing protein n=1 Tax=Suhomyces tanzawaensis NRRL Y-17324 TaxID=984487 RepID=A0A1E4SJ75_9ASCO|nr:uncharacterized protein CANTADRAFT_50740 [Suhomyces tanzawaensis NRRL Y-17324]ODV79565.1 hypothetical protein CANTADRAFT_50740 [Suhomyces tanzawaensis NRRL Y-17324]
MYTEQLVSKQGPLAHVWLAANYDKKLTKQQLLSTSIVKSSDFISNHPISHSSSQGSQQDSNSITLRLSGQLLLGIVRIYSRKTKYLLDDVNDILLKLKTSFKYASGVKLGSDISANKVNLQPQDTIITNVKSITLQDQVTRFDLLYQDDLNLDDDFASGGGRGIFSQSQNTEDSFTFDQSIEFGRYEEPQDPVTPGNDYGLELDFDLNDDDASDHSIEVGRNVSQLANDAEMSVLSIGKDINEEPALDFDLGEPLDTIEEPELENASGAETSDGPEEPTTPQPILPPRPRTKRNRITEEGELITTKRKLKVDSSLDLDGIPILTLKENQQLILNGFGKDDTLTLNLSEAEKLQLIYELSAPISSNKRRKLWNIDTLLQERCIELARQEKELEEQHNLQFEQEFDDFDNNLDFDLSLPDFDNEDNGPEDSFANQIIDEIQEEETEEEDITNGNVARSTIQVADHLRSILGDKGESDLAALIEKDLKINDDNNELLPLGTTSRSSDSKKVNQRKEATKCFFELLVLATNDCIEIEQEAHETKIGADINIRSRDRLFSSFL